MSGQAASYYDPNEGFAQEQGKVKPDNYNNDYEQRGNGYQPQQPAPEAKPPGPPEYPDHPPPPYSTFDEAFKIEKPKWNDVWAGLLVSDIRDLAWESGLRN